VDNISPLGAVMAFLHSTSLFMPARYVDFVGNGNENHNVAKLNFAPLPRYSDNYINVRDTVFNNAGV